jgi:hypothetical protein
MTDRELVGEILSSGVMSIFNFRFSVMPETGLCAGVVGGGAARHRQAAGLSLEPLGVRIRFPGRGFPGTIGVAMTGKAVNRSLVDATRFDLLFTFLADPNGAIR